MHESFDPDETIVDEASSTATPQPLKKKKKKRKKSATPTATERFLLRGTLLESPLDVELKSEQIEKQKSAISGGDPAERHDGSRGGGGSVNRKKRVTSPTRNRPPARSLPPLDDLDRPPSSGSSRDPKRRTRSEIPSNKPALGLTGSDSSQRRKKKRRKRKTPESAGQTTPDGGGAFSAVSGCALADEAMSERYALEGSSSDCSRTGFGTDSDNAAVVVGDSAQQRGQDSIETAVPSGVEKPPKAGGRTRLLSGGNRVSPGDVDSPDTADRDWTRRSPSMSESGGGEERRNAGTGADWSLAPARPDSGTSYVHDDEFRTRGVGKQRDLVSSASSRHDHSIKLDVTSLPPLWVFQCCQHPTPLFILSSL